MDALFVMNLLKSFLNAFNEENGYNNHYNIKDYIYRSIHGRELSLQNKKYLAKVE